MGSRAAIGQEEAYLSLMRPVRTDYVYKWRAACSLLQQTKRPPLYPVGPAFPSRRSGGSH